MDHRSGGERQAFVDLGIEGCEQAVEIGRGGFSVVYRAWQPAFSRHVAVKVLPADLDTSEVDRFSRECEALGSLQGHPNIVAVHEAGRLASGQPFIVMEFLSEGSLQQRIAARPLAWPEAVDIGIKLAGALESAHRAGVLHRDVKPGNVMLSRYGDPKLGDFGIARLEGRLETRSGAITASWSHAPPEVVDGRRPTTASDVYSLASTLFTLIDGAPPFRRTSHDTLVAFLSRIVRDPVRPIGTVTPAAVERVIRQGLAKEPAQRQSSAAELGRQLQAAQSENGRRITALPLAIDETTVSPPDEDGGAVTEPVEVVTVVPTETAVRHAPAAPSSGSGPATRRWGGLAAAAIVAVVLALAAVILVSDRGGEEGATATSTPTTTLTPDDTTGSTPTTALTTRTTVVPAATVPTTPTAPTTTVQGVRLGQALAPVSTEPCRSPSTASGAAWQISPVQLGGRPFDAAYNCNLFAGGTGSLDFVLGNSYRLLTTSIGFADGSTSTGHVVRFEFIGDGRENLIEPTTVRFGNVQNLQVDVSGVTRLKIRITELSPPGGTEGASKPVLATPTLTPV